MCGDWLLYYVLLVEPIAKTVAGILEAKGMTAVPGRTLAHPQTLVDIWHEQPVLTYKSGFGPIGGGTIKGGRTIVEQTIGKIMTR